MLHSRVNTQLVLPLVTAANLTATTGGRVSTLASAPSATETPNGTQRQGDSHALLEFLKNRLRTGNGGRRTEGERGTSKRGQRHFSHF